MVSHAITIFLSAFLLFQIQPIIARQILPWFGGSAAVWTTCMFFFQLVLLGGYLYSHWLVSALRPARQFLVHASLLCLSLWWLPAIADPARKPSGAEAPAWAVLAVLAATVGLPYFLLSTTGPLVQAWCAGRSDNARVYRLYALSNTASLAALLAYPVLVEPLIALRTQAWLWSGGYAAFAAVCGAAAYRSWRAAGLRQDTGQLAEAAERPRSSHYAVWLLLAALPSALLLGVTNYLTRDVAPIPFLWILPLAAYLLSFILCFDRDGWYRPAWYVWILAAAALAMGAFLWNPRLALNFPLTIAAFTAGLFVSCMFCHGELVRRKPHPRHLTGFYLMISAGGALGGFLVGIVAPSAFSGYYELPITLVALAMLALYFFQRLRWQTDAVWLGVCVFVTLPSMYYVKSHSKLSVAVDRNFYGSIRVLEERDVPHPRRTLVHDGVAHGSQRLAPDQRRTPFGYYDPASGVGLVMSNRSSPPIRVGIVGLGSGALAAYAREGDVFRFYEINPLVERYARQYFTYLQDAPARVDVVLGDARLALEAEKPQNYDILVVDAFSGDSVPVHLLSLEAFRLYFRHLRGGGVLALHISSQYLDLTPVVGKAAETLGAASTLVVTENTPEDPRAGSTWALLSLDPAALAAARRSNQARPLPRGEAIQLWTDDYSNLFSVLR